MAKLKNQTKARRSLATAAAMPVVREALAQDTTRALNAVARGYAAGEEKLAKLYEAATDKTSKTHKGAVDMSGSIIGVLSFESLNWMVRYLGEKFPNAIGESVDYWQSIPALVIGIVAYWGELLTRKSPTKGGPPVWPSMPREIASEWSKVFMLLGMSNLLRALRVRRKDAALRETELAKVQAELSSAQAELAKLKARA